MSIEQIDICKELGQNFIDFSYEANSCRAFADARDGLKPGQRACLWEMFTKGYSSSKAHVKSAKIAGGVVGTWWPHGDVAIYDTFTRMSQKWINNIPEVDWHGNNGSQIMPDAAASARYTEARLSKIIEEGMLSGIKKNKVDMILNYSEDEEWPEVLPAILPRLMINGCQGIGSTIANVWLPHNFKEVGEILINYIDTGKLDYSNLYPDFPTGCQIINKKDISTIYSTGKGKVVLRARATIEGQHIYFKELPYQTYVEPLIEKIKDLVLKEEITGIESIYNRSSKNGIEIDIECNTTPAVVLKKLYAKTDLQKSYSANQWALVGKTPKLLTLKEYCDIYIDHNSECIKREAEYDLNKANAQLEIINGLLKALEDIDNIIALIKNSESAAAARAALSIKYKFTEAQAKAIVDMKLGKLAGLEKMEIQNDKKELINLINSLNAILSDIPTELCKRLQNLVSRYGDARRTQITQLVEDSKEEKEIEFVEPEKCVVVLTESGFIKRIPANSFKTQKRNGKGIKTQDDITNMVLRTNTIDSLMIFTNKGKMYRLLVDNIPVGTNVSKGTPINSLVELEYEERPTVIYSIYRDTDAKYVLFVTKNGLVKKTALEEYIKTKKKSGLGAITLRENDELITVCLIKDELLTIVTKNGYSITFDSKEIGASSRMTQGVKGINLTDDSVVAALPVRNPSDNLAIFSWSGSSKKIIPEELIIQKRGGKGVKCFKGVNVNDKVADACLVSDEDKVLIVGDHSSICVSAKDIPYGSRIATGNLMIKNSNIISVSKV